MTPESEERPTATPTLRQIISAALIGAAVEWYDFVVYAAAAALVFPKIFFPSVSEPGGLLAAFATLGAGFLARPMGAPSSGTSVTGSAARRCWWSR